MKAIDRLFQYLEHKGIDSRIFEKASGLPEGLLNKLKDSYTDMREAEIAIIIGSCHDLSPQWLLTGTGEMLSTSATGANTGNDVSSLFSSYDKLISTIQNISFAGTNVSESNKSLARSNELLASTNETLVTKIAFLLEELKKIRPSTSAYPSEKQRQGEVSDKEEGYCPEK